MNIHDRHNLRRLRAFVLPCAIASWICLPAPPAEAQFLDDSQANAAVPEEKPLGERNVSVSDFMEVTLHVQDTELIKVLQMLSIQSQKNIITSPSVSARVSADLYDVSFYEALDALLHINGYGYKEKGNFIYVYTQEELRAMEEASRAPVTKVISLNYINASDAAVFVTPALSDVGQISLNGPVQQGMEPSLGNAGQDDWAFSGKLVVRDYPENVEEIQRIVRELDTRPSQVLVEATIMQTTLTEENAFGVDFSIIADVNFSDFITGPLGVTDSLRVGNTPGATGVVPDNNRGTGLASTVGNTGGSAGFKVGVIHDDFSIFMRLLDEVTDSVILSSPKILCLNRQRARVQVGRNIGYLSTTATDTSTTQTVEFLPTGTTLTFRPFITNEGMIRMELAPRVSEGIIREVTTSAGATVTIPDEITQELTTNVLVRDGNTIVLGGLFRETTRITKRQVPFLGDLPLLGAAFRGHEDATDRTEIVFMVRPTIVNDAVLVEQSRRAIEYADLARTGVRRALLPWSEERLSAQWNQDAMNYARAGDYRKALWAVERSLSVNPIQPRALELREKLLNERDRVELPSILRDIYDDSFEQQMRELEKSISDAKAEQQRQFEQRLADMDRIWHELNPPTALATTPTRRERAQDPAAGQTWERVAAADDVARVLADILGVEMRWLQSPQYLVSPMIRQDESAPTMQATDTWPARKAATFTGEDLTQVYDMDAVAGTLADLMEVRMRWAQDPKHVVTWLIPHSDSRASYTGFEKPTPAPPADRVAPTQTVELSDTVDVASALAEILGIHMRWVHGPRHRVLPTVLTGGPEHLALDAAWRTQDAAEEQETVFFESFDDIAVALAEFYGVSMRWMDDSKPFRTSPLLHGWDEAGQDEGGARGVSTGAEPLSSSK